MAPGPRDAIALRTLRMLGTRVADGGDVDWHPASLASRVVECFDAVQRAWTRRDEHGLRPYVSDAMHARIDSWLDGFEDLSQVNRIEDLELERTRLVRIEFGDSGEQDRLVVDVGFTARDWLEDVRNGAILDGHPDAATRFDQQWTFSRDAELGWVIDTVDPQSAQVPSPPAPGRPAPEGRWRREVPERSGDPRPAPAARTTPAPPPPAYPPPGHPVAPPGAAPARRRSIPGHPGAAPGARPQSRTSTRGGLRVALLLLLCVAVVAGAARAGLSLGQDSAADPAATQRARLDAQQAVAGQTFRRAYAEAQARGRVMGLARGRKAGRTRGARQGRRAGRAEGQRQAAVRDAATAASAAQARAATANRSAAPRTTTAPRR